MHGARSPLDARDRGARAPRRAGAGSIAPVELSVHGGDGLEVLTAPIGIESGTERRSDASQIREG